MTSATCDLTKVTILLAEPIETVPLAKITKKLSKRLGLNVVEVLAERADV